MNFPDLKLGDDALAPLVTEEVVKSLLPVVDNVVRETVNVVQGVVSAPVHVIGVVSNNDIVPIPSAFVTPICPDTDLDTPDDYALMQESLASMGGLEARMEKDEDNEVFFATPYYI